MKLTFLVDNRESWIAPLARAFANELRVDGHTVTYCERAEDVREGDVAFFLGCEQLIPKAIRVRHRHNLVVHESALPKGKGWSPLSWQIMEGKKEIHATLFEAEDAVDAGNIYAQRVMHFVGTELVDELRDEQWKTTKALIRDFLAKYPHVAGRAQEGEESFYPRRTPKDSELDVNKTISAQFDTLRVVDNERYPAFFSHRGRTYILKIFRKE